MKLYKNETKAVVRLFRYHHLSFPTCISRLDAALVRFIPKLKPEQIDELRSVMQANNEAVMKEAALRAGNLIAKQPPECQR